MMMYKVLTAGFDQGKKELKFLFFIFLIMGVFGVVVMQPMQRIYDEQLRERPFMTAFVEVTHNPFDKPFIKYATRAEIPLKGTWSAWVMVNGKRGCGGNGTSGYGPPPRDAEQWEWAYWLGKDCDVPPIPFSVCVRYSIETLNGVGDVSGPFCSGIYNPYREMKGLTQ
jgi:hypothetical protein